MASRILRDSFATSESVARCAPAAQDRLPRYWLLADDFGCFQIQSLVIKGRIWALREDMTPAHIEDDLREYEAAGMLQTWTDAKDGKKYAYFTGWFRHNRTPKPASKRRTPPPPEARTADIPGSSAQNLPNTQSESQLHDQAQTQTQVGSPGKSAGADVSAPDPVRLVEPPLAQLESDWDPDLLQRVKLAVASTRQYGRMADGPWRGFLVSAAQFSREVREVAATRYLDKGCAADGKAEKYLLGIMAGEVRDSNAKAARGGGGPVPPGSSRRNGNGHLPHLPPPDGTDYGPAGRQFFDPPRGGPKA